MAEEGVGASGEAGEAGKVQVLDGQPLVEEATALKEKANACVKRKQHQEAVALYEEGLAVLDRCRGQPMLREESQQVDGLKAVLHSNISQCMLSLELYRRAVEAAGKCLELDPSNAKALHRKSQAHEALREYEDALKDALQLRKIGGGGLKEKEVEERCEQLLLKVQNENTMVNKVGKEHEELFKMKERFDKVWQKYDLEGSNAAPEVAKWLVEDKDFDNTVGKIAKRWQMEKRDAQDLARWISKGLELKIIPDPSAASSEKPAAS